MNSSSERERRLVSGLDLINNLPGYVVDKILVHLPIKDAVRTSILSRNWRYRWVTIPEIVFIMRRRPDAESDKENTLMDHACVKIVYQEIYCLTLHKCIFNLPSTFKGFHCLKILFLNDIIFSNDELEFLISNSPLLESLTFMDVNHSNRLKINAPNLQYLKVRGQFNVFSFENTPVLASASIFLVSGDEFSLNLEPVETCSFTKLLSCLRNIEKPVLGSDFLKVFASGDVPHRVPYTFDHLKELYLDINLEDPNQILAAC
ncbi:F-box/FBD/LRR-repeat protein At1g13570-like [Tasmannia lanceolata]|uniref:F-box/FBD/LRR-repeat protein At1g13570-like n=1 Tax=Tasmannia lanceolata TaxID=3420 RepID=UPI004064757F